jgi:hypothetical protein
MNLICYQKHEVIIYGQKKNYYLFNKKILLDNVSPIVKFCFQQQKLMINGLKIKCS